MEEMSLNRLKNIVNNSLKDSEVMQAFGVICKRIDFWLDRVAELESENECLNSEVEFLRQQNSNLRGGRIE